MCRGIDGTVSGISGREYDLMNNSFYDFDDNLEMKDCFIAYFDILGYESIVKSKNDYDIKTLHSNINNCVKQTKHLLLLIQFLYLYCYCLYQDIDR